MGSAFFLMLPAVLAPLECCFGTSPIPAEKFAQSEGLWMGDAGDRTIADSGPMPGSRRRATCSSHSISARPGWAVELQEVCAFNIRS